MKRRHLPYLAAAAALLAAALLLAHRFGWFDTSTAPVVLPETSPYAAPSPPEGRGGLVPAKVTPETVQAVVATLSRPDGYSRRLQVVSSWLGGEAAWQVRVWHKGTATRIRIFDDLRSNGHYLAGAHCYKHFINLKERGEKE